MTNKNFHLLANGLNIRLITIMLVFVIAVPSFNDKTSIIEMEMEKIEKLSEIEIDNDLENQEKKPEIGEDSFVRNFTQNSIFNKAGLIFDQKNTLHTIYHLKIPTPPPDLLMIFLASVV